MKARPGTVYLVGAGPGDPGLITRRGLDLLRTCDVVLYDRLVSPVLLDEARAGAERIFVGKQPGEVHSRQVVSDALVVGRARDGKSVVRLKGGDPFVFGRGGEEALLLRDADIPFEVVPGVSSAIAAPAYAGIPVTHRGLSHSFVVLTAREEGTTPQEEPVEATVAADTIVLLMGASALDVTAERLVRGGRDAGLPAAAIQWGTTGRQRVVVGTLGTISADVRREGLGPPITTIIGEVVSLHGSLEWFGQRPLLGRTIVVTRAAGQSAGLNRKLLELGADVLLVPVIEIVDPTSWEPVDRAIDELGAGAYDWVVFTSRNAVERFFDRVVTRGRDVRICGQVKIAAVGTTTSHALAERSLVSDLVPRVATASALATTLGSGSGRLLFPRVEDGPKDAIRILDRGGWKVDEVAVYRNVPGTPPPAAVASVQAGEVDLITFTSASTVRNLVDLIGVPDAVPAVCIGPVTAAAAKDAGLQVAAVAEPHDSDGLIDAVVTVVTGS